MTTTPDPSAMKSARFGQRRRKATPMHPGSGTSTAITRRNRIPASGEDRRASAQAQRGCIEGARRLPYDENLPALSEALRHLRRQESLCVGLRPGALCGLRRAFMTVLPANTGSLFLSVEAPPARPLPRSARGELPGTPVDGEARIKRLLHCHVRMLLEVDLRHAEAPLVPIGAGGVRYLALYRLKMALAPERTVKFRFIDAVRLRRYMNEVCGRGSGKRQIENNRIGGEYPDGGR